MIRPPYCSFQRPDPLQEGLTPQRAAVEVLVLACRLPLHDVLRGDAGVIRAGDPEHVAPLHPAPAREDVLQRVVQRVADVQEARDVRRRDHDRDTARPAGGVGVKQAGVDPALVPAVFDVVGTVGFIELWSGHRLGRTLDREHPAQKHDHGIE
jgi:hypothetical protein